MLRLYLVQNQTEINKRRWDIYSEFVVCANSSKDARKIHPSYPVSCLEPRSDFTEEEIEESHKLCWEREDGKYGTWIPLKDIDKLTVTRLGRADPSIQKGIVSDSFHAG